MPMSSLDFKIGSFDTLSSAARLEAKTAGACSLAMRASVALVSAISLLRSLIATPSDAGAVVVGRRGRSHAEVAGMATEQRYFLVDRGLVGFREIGQAFQRVVDVSV